MPRDQYQTVKEIGDRLAVSEAMVRSWIKDGTLRAIDIGKGWRIADRDFEAFLNSHATRTRDARTEMGRGAPDTGSASDRDG